MVDMPTHGNKLDKVPLDGVVNIKNYVVTKSIKLITIFVGRYFYIGKSKCS